MSLIHLPQALIQRDAQDGGDLILQPLDLQSHVLPLKCTHPFKMFLEGSDLGEIPDSIRLEV